MLLSKAMGMTALDWGFVCSTYLQAMALMKNAATVEELNRLENHWQDFKALLVAFITAYKKSIKILKDSIAARMREVAKKKRMPRPPSTST